MKITPQTVLLNDEDFHSVEIIETVVRQSEVLAHRKKWLFCKVTPVSIQTFVEGLLRLANVLETTHGTPKNVNNICTLAINSTTYVVLFPATLLVYDDECCICLQHLQRLSPQVWLWHIVVLGLEISARINRFLRLFGCLEATFFIYVLYTEVCIATCEAI